MSYGKSKDLCRGSGVEPCAASVAPPFQIPLPLAPWSSQARAGALGSAGTAWTRHALTERAGGWSISRLPTQQGPQPPGTGTSYAWTQG